MCVPGHGKGLGSRLTLSYACTGYRRLGSQTSIKLCMSLTWEIGFFLNGRVLYNSRAVISDIGEGSSALYCLTDREECCSTHKCPGLPSVVLPVLKCPCVPGYPGMSQASRDVPGCPGMSQGSFTVYPTVSIILTPRGGGGGGGGV